MILINYAKLIMLCNSLLKYKVKRRHTYTRKKNNKEDYICILGMFFIGRYK